ncbi:MULTISPECIES: NfeD family protein [Microvirga]|uniref:NfeD family protein n=1 Tax=Microvirga TaxID=186650 RepID=UPI001CFFE754|nr:NfeD family protein [Microvirga lenta]MCB5177295.1 NfeD family protein [Microvirga lenta]
MIADAVAGLGAWIWIILGLVLIGLELLLPASFFIWLGLAAILTGLLDAALSLSWQACALVFAALSLAAAILGRMIMRPGTQPDTQADRLNQRGQSLVGQVFTLETPIKGGEGRIRVGDSSWRVTGADRFAGARVRVVRIEGTTLVVDDP